MNVVMVHGFWDTGRLFGALARTLEAEGHRCHTPTLHPRDGRLGIPDLAAKLALYVDGNVERGGPAAFVGFSMGALVVRHHLQELGGARFARAFFSIAGPHDGSYAAYLYPGLGTLQMRPGSALIKRLGDGSDGLAGMPVFTYRTPFDLMVFPARSSRMANATEVVVWCPFHALMPSDPTVIAHIAGELAKMESRSPGSHPA
jgi:triacylglycerol lipase